MRVHIVPGVEVWRQEGLRTRYAALSEALCIRKKRHQLALQRAVKMVIIAIPANNIVTVVEVFAIVRVIY